MLSKICSNWFLLCWIQFLQPHQVHIYWNETITDTYFIFLENKNNLEMIDGLSWDKRNCSSGERTLAFREWKHSRFELHFKNYSKCVEWNRKRRIQTNETAHWEFKLEHQVCFLFLRLAEFLISFSNNLPDISKISPIPFHYNKSNKGRSSPKASPRGPRVSSPLKQARKTGG